MNKLSSFWLSCLLVSLFTVTTNVAADHVKKPAKASTEKKITKTQVYKIKSKSPISFFLRPTVHSGVVIKVPANSRWIIRLAGVKKYSSSIWYEVSWNGKKGWVKKKEIIYDSRATNIAARRPDCLLSKTRSKDCDLSS